ncbi:Capn15 [Symbiodinium pilosum]|uniref:Capn15 protein n=1 Tax=Symbiodinium pilosum TaxID=2952 RepID=A0A812Y0C7_SYMPI|nr:Capn15 [Symbiodinium pilosum]
MKPGSRVRPAALVAALVLLLWEARSPDPEAFACAGKERAGCATETAEDTSGVGRRGLMAAMPAGLAAASPAVADDSKVEWKKLRDIQYIAALANPTASSGAGAEQWGLWRKDPGPRGVRLYNYDKLMARGGVAPAQWQFDKNDWWLEEHGLIMEKPEFPLPPGKYLVTGDREVTTTLTVSEKDASGAQKWSLGKGTLYDVTHLPCRSARYTPAGGTCQPTNELELEFPVRPGAVMPPQAGCNKQDYAVLFVLAVAPFEDLDFPAESKSICGREEESAQSPHEPPRCRCGQTSKKSEVRKDGPTKGRPYWHCEKRRCGFFAWADSENRRREKIWWQRFPEFMVVSDFGFRAEDLRQGGVGDCWFMSALAVVAERPDLILRLFGGETARNSVGCYQVNLFLDGEWRAVNIDDRLPCTDQQRRPDGSGLAFSRADGQQLWTPLLEKAYAKAHGSYRAISGGEIAEALLDLTGCPTESIDFDEPGFDPQELWERLVDFKAKSFPMGCATAGNPELREVGLCGNHAYSILDVRELYDQRFVGKELGYGGAQQDGLVRLLRIRNPHGMGEWNGEWSDRSTEWTDSLSSALGCTGVDDGTFWMDYTHFLMGFQVVDVCLAHRGWHAASFPNAFCAKSSGSRICKYFYELRCDTAATLYAMALQPTKRGSWCREDRKKSYKPGDISLLVLRIGTDQQFSQVVGGNFFCADIMARRCVEARLESGQRYLLVAFSFGAGPVAHGGEARTSAPFKMRLFSSQPLGVKALEPEKRPQLAAAALTGLHAACLTLKSVPGRRFRRLARPLSTGLSLFQVTGEGAVLLLLANATSSDVTVKITAEVKVMTARCSEGLLAAAPGQDQDKSSEVTCFNCGKPGHIARDCTGPRQRGIRTPWRYPAKWRRVSTACRVPSASQRLVLALVGNGMQTEIGGVEVQVADGSEDCPIGKRRSRGHRQQQLQSYLQSPSAEKAEQPLDAFEPRKLMQGLVEEAMAAPVAPGQKTIGSAVAEVLDWISEESLAQAAAASLEQMRMQEEQQLQQALAASRGVSAVDIQPESEDRLLAAAMAASKEAQVIETSRKELLAAEEAELQAALLLSRGMLAAPQLVVDSSEEETCEVPPLRETKRHKAAT